MTWSSESDPRKNTKKPEQLPRNGQVWGSDAEKSAFLTVRQCQCLVTSWELNLNALTWAESKHWWFSSSPKTRPSWNVFMDSLRTSQSGLQITQIRLPLYSQHRNHWHFRSIKLLDWLSQHSRRKLHLLYSGFPGQPSPSFSRLRRPEPVSERHSVKAANLSASSREFWNIANWRTRLLKGKLWLSRKAVVVSLTCYVRHEF